MQRSLVLVVWWFRCKFFEFCENMKTKLMNTVLTYMISLDRDDSGG